MSVDKHAPARILLIFPPFAHPRSPHLAIPTLVAYLRQHRIPVEGIDANIEFFHYLLSEKRIQEGKIFVEDKLKKLKAIGKRSEEEELEYETYNAMLHGSPNLPLNAEFIFGMAEKQRMNERQRAFCAAASIASAPYYPEFLTIDAKTRFALYTSPVNKYSTGELSDSVLEDEGLISDFFEAILPPLLNRFEPTIVGISISFDDQIQAALRCSRVIKSLSSHIHVTIGGAFVSSAMRHLSNPHSFKFIDSMVLDDGEIPLERLASEVAKARPDFRKVPGLVYLEGKEIQYNPTGHPMDLETLPPPDYTSMDLDRYLMPRKQMYAPFRSSRGCYWARCAFCRTELPMIRCHQRASADFVYETILTVTKQTGIGSFAFTDEACSPEEMAALSKILTATGLAIKWGANFRMDPALTLRRCRLYARAGCTNINFGLETYNDRLLKFINKGITQKAIDTVLSNCFLAGVFVWTYLMVGIPSETEMEAIEGYRKIRKLQQDGLIGGYLYTPFHLFQDTLFYREAEKYGITGISIPEGQDLGGPIWCFETEGIPRLSAGKLASAFNAGMRK